MNLLCDQGWQVPQRPFPQSEAVRLCQLTPWLIPSVNFNHQAFLEQCKNLVLRFRGSRAWLPLFLAQRTPNPAKRHSHPQPHASRSPFQARKHLPFTLFACKHTLCHIPLSSVPHALASFQASTRAERSAARRCSSIIFERFYREDS